MAIINGTKKNNELHGTKKADVIHGLGGNDTIWGMLGNDKLFGDDGNDRFVAHLGTDKIDGGKGIDILDLRSATAGVTMDMNEKTVSYAIGAKTGQSDFKSIEWIYATALGDSVTGDANDNLIYTFEGDDTIVGGSGNDAFDAGAGDDEIDGDDGDDRLVLSSGNDDFDGGVGSNTIDFIGALSGITLSLSSGTVNFEDGNGLGVTTFSNVANAWGSQLGDELTGDDNANTLLGAWGDDTIEGRGGDDVINGGATAIGNSGGDDDIIDGGNGNDTIIVSAAVDEVDGGDGLDALDFIDATDRIFLTISDGTVDVSTFLGGGVTSFTNIEDLLGSNFADELLGDTGSNLLAGRDGNDAMDGLQGADILSGGNGNDTITGGAGADAFLFTAKASATKNFDSIEDFAVADDGLYFDDAVFALTGTGGETALRSYVFRALDGAQFQASESSVAANVNVRLIYETDTGILFYDADGSRSGKAVRVAQLDVDLALTADDFFVI